MSNKDLRLAADYWDCECTERYIHFETVDYCPLCNTGSEDQPRSILSEVAAHLGIDESRIRVEKEVI